MLNLASPSTHLELNFGVKECKSAGDWFCLMFPLQAQVFGSPFLQQDQENRYGGVSSVPVVLNVDFFAACLAYDDRLGFRVVFDPAQLQFFFYDPRDEIYHSTTAEKLGTLLRALFVRCANEVKGEAHLFNLFHTFRSDAVVKAVVNRCKSVAEIGPAYFQFHQRIEGPEIHIRLARVFAEKMLEPNPNSILTIGQAYHIFSDFAKQKNMPVIKRNEFKSMMAEVIRDKYDLGVRNDLMNVETQKQGCGWRGLRPVISA